MADWRQALPAASGTVRMQLLPDSSAGAAGQPEPEPAQRGQSRPGAMSSERFDGTLTIARELSDAPNEDKTPYATKYEAREILENLKAELMAGGGSGSAAELIAGRVAIVDSILGTNFIDCEENPAGEKCLVSALESLKGQAKQYLSALQEVYNSLGVLWCGRGEYAKAKVRA